MTDARQAPDFGAPQVNLSVVRGLFVTSSPNEENLYVLEPYRYNPQDTSDEVYMPVKIAPHVLDVWSGMLSQRMQGPDRLGAKEFFERMHLQPGISLGTFGFDQFTIAAFSEIQTHWQGGREVYEFSQAGVVWPHNTEKPDDLAPEQYHEALAAVVFCNVVDLDPEARIYVTGYKDDTRTQDGFFGSRAGFVANPKGRRWGTKGARLESTCGVVASTLLNNFAFLAVNKALPPSE